MIRFVGSEFNYQGQLLVVPEVIYVQDHHYDESNNCFPLEALLKNSVCDPKEHTVIFDHVVQHDDRLGNYNLICLPVFLAKECREFNEQQIQPNWDNKTCVFNFMINKPRRHREMLLERIKHFDLTNYSHSLAWRNNYVNDIPVTNYLHGTEFVMDHGVRSGNIRNAKNYQALLQTTVFEPSCISLITEPVWIERETIVTEKTLMSMWAGTFPIWFGGWRIPDYLKSLGFDVFDDVIDHGYQAIDDPWHRCYRAISGNLELLTDLEKVKKLNETCRPRFEKNLQLLKDNVFQQHCYNEAEKYPEEIRQNLFAVFENSGVDKV